MADGANTFTGIHAGLYDLVYADKPYADEAGWVLDRLGALDVMPTRLLDLACGSGRHAEQFSARGIEVTGVDINYSLVEQARERVPAAHFKEGDMRELELGVRFDAVTCLFDSIGYPRTDEGVTATLATVARHLADDGAAAIEFLHAPAMRAGASPVRVRRLPTPGGGMLVRIAETEIGEHEMEVAYELIELRPDGTYERTVERQWNRYFEIAKMTELMERAGLAPTAFLPAYGEGEVTAADFHVMALARRAP